MCIYAATAGHDILRGWSVRVFVPVDFGRGRFAEIPHVIIILEITLFDDGTFNWPLHKIQFSCFPNSELYCS